jgi:hypothetical protein
MFPETNLMIYGIVCNNTYIYIIMRLDVIDTNPGLITPSSSEFTNWVVPFSKGNITI